jgi:Arc/MetJ-type ribon-helix-helix transcriptional regulator
MSLELIGLPGKRIAIDFVLEGELAETLLSYVERGMYASKPEVIRDALRHLFEHLEEVDLQMARRAMMNR